MLGAIAVGSLLAVSTSAQAPQPTTPVPAPPAVWTLSEGFALPESAYHDPVSNAVFVSSINGDLLAKDGNGYVSRLTADGKVVNAKWVTGLNGPKGMRSAGGTLWVADIDEVVAVDIASGKITARVRVDGATFLNDLATAPDGTVFVSDSQGSKIYAVKDGRSSVFVEGADLVQQPNGLLVDGNRLVLGTVGPVAAPGAARGAGRGRGGPPAGGILVAFDLKTKQRTLLTTGPVGGVDGIEPDGKGGLLITDVFGSRIVHVPVSGPPRTVLQLAAAGADFSFIPATRTAIVPFLFGNSVSAYDLTAMLK
jgi:sugar lactone lactonase YvrE